MHLYLLRHCEPESGGNNPLLTQHGKTQARLLGDVLANVIPAGAAIKILTSDLTRAARTAKIIRKKLNVTEEPTQFAGATDQTDTEQVQWLMNELRLVATDIDPRSSFFPTLPNHIVVVWHYPRVAKALDWLVGDGVLEWPNIYGAVACIDCDTTFSSGSGNLRWFLWADMLI